MVDGLFKGDILIVITEISLGGRSIDGFRKLVRLLEAFRKLDTANSTVLLIGSPAGTGDITTNDTFYRKHLKLLNLHDMSLEFFLLEEFRKICKVGRNHMIRKDILSVVKPELGHAGKDCALINDLVLKNYIKCGDTICRIHYDCVANVIDLSYFTFLNGFQLGTHESNFSFHNHYLNIILAGLTCFYIIADVSKK